jgi:hypothetical protein
MPASSFQSNWNSRSRIGDKPKRACAMCSKRLPWIAWQVCACMSGALASQSATWAQNAGEPLQQAQPLDSSKATTSGPGIANAADGGPGGSAMADFDSLIDLITSTVEAESWLDSGTGQGQIMPFDGNGVYVDGGALKVERNPTDSELASIGNARSAPAPPRDVDRQASALNARRPVKLRFVSLNRLEAAIAERQSERRPFDPAMLALAGLQRITLVAIFPETGDVTIAGPAGDWQIGPGASMVSAATGRPVVRLDDLLAVWRQQRASKGAPFGCSIVPRRESLADVQAFLAKSAGEAIEPSHRRLWLRELRESLGEQDVEYFSLRADTRLARVLLAADYHMKLIGMGLAPGVPGVRSYLSTVRLDRDGSPPPMSILRWWFAMPAATVAATADRDVFALPARCVEVLSENELLAARGERVHTGQSDELNRQFADSFTAEFAALAAKYPIYGELERVFELAAAVALIENEQLARRVGWSPGLLLDEQRLRLTAPTAVTSLETVVNHRVLGGKHIVAGISGGVMVDAARSQRVDSTGAASGLTAAISPTAPPAAGVDSRPTAGAIQWWWD